MDKILFLTFLLFTVISEPACESKEKDDYEERVAGVIKYLDKEHHFAPKECITLFLLQSDKCNICTLTNLQEMQADSATKNKMVFVLADGNDSVYNFVNESFQNKEILIDNKNALGKYGLSFMRNLKANICDDEVKSYKFY